MANDFFNHNNPLTRHTLGRAEEVNNIFEAVAAGFDLLPDADEFGENQYAQDTGAANAYVVTLDPDPLSYYEGLRLLMKAVNANTGASTINANGIGVKTIKRYNGDDLQANDITAGMIVYLIYDGTNFRIVSAHGADVALAQSWASSTGVVSGGLKGARGYAQDASTSASAASSSASGASTSAANALSSYQSFLGTYYGPLSSDPALDPLGNAPGAGDWYFNTSTIQSRIYSGSAWGNVAAVLTGMENGSAANPGLPFAADLDTGLYHIGANNFGFSTGGTLRWDVSTTAITSTLPKLGPNGSVGAPSLSFSADTDTGFYRNAANDMRVAAGGVEVAAFLSDGTYITARDGSASSPQFTFLSDTDTGIYRVGPNSFGFATAATLKWFFDANGNLISSSGTPLLYTGDGSVSFPAYSFTNDVDTGLYRVSANRLGFAVGGSLIFDVVVGGAGVRSGSLYIQSGSSSAPGLQLDADSDTGLYSTGAGHVAITCGGSAGLSIFEAAGGNAVSFGFNSSTAISLNGQVGVLDGSNSAPTYSFQSDLNTGMYRVGGDIIGFTAGGVNVLRISNDYVRLTGNGYLQLTDGQTAPSTVAGFAQIYVDSADGDLKVKFGDGTVKTIIVDT